MLLRWTSWRRWLGVVALSGCLSPSAEPVDFPVQRADAAQVAEARKALESVGILGLTDPQVRLWDVLGQQLLYVLNQYKQADPSWAASLVDADAASEDHNLLLELRADPQDLKGQKLPELVQELGLELLAEIDAYSCEVLIPIDRLESVANDPRIAAIRRITQPEATGGGNPSFPVADMTGVTNARWWHDNGIRGEGVTVVIVDEFRPAPPEHAMDPIVITNETRAELYRLSRRRSGPVTSPRIATHGWRMEEQIRGIAPAANVVRIEIGPSSGTSVAALRAAATFPNAIVNFSNVYPIDRPSSPLSPRGPISTALENLSTTNAVVASAGNDGRNHWSGNFVCSGIRGSGSFASSDSCFLNWGQFSPVAGYPYSPGADGNLQIAELGLYATGFDRDRAVNVLGCVARPGTTSRNPVSLVISLGASADLQPVVVRKENDFWAPALVVPRNVQSSYATRVSFLETTSPPLADWRIPSLPGEPDCVNGISVGLVLVRAGGAAPGKPTYVNVFGAIGGSISVSTNLASIAESNVGPNVLTVGGTLCTGVSSACVGAGLPHPDYSVGPAVLGGRQPTFVRDGTGPGRSADGIAIVPELSRIARDRARRPEVKPDFIVPTAGYGGTSQAAAMASGLLALLRQRYPTLSNAELISATHRIAERRRSNYATYTDPRTLLIEGLTTSTYGRGVFTLEKEAGVALRGQLNNVRLNAFITSSPSGAPPDGSMAYANTFPSSESQLAEPHWGWGFGPYPTLYFSSVAFTSTRASSFQDECARFSDRVRFPVLTPYVRFDAHLSAPAGGARVGDFDGGGVSIQWCPRVLPPSVSGAPFLASTGIFSDARMAPRTGAFEFTRMRITRMPTLPSGAPASVALNYGLVLASKRPDGQVVHSDDVPEHTLEIDLCDNASSDPRCPAIATR